MQIYLAPALRAGAPAAAVVHGDLGRARDRLVAGAVAPPHGQELLHRLLAQEHAAQRLERPAPARLLGHRLAEGIVDLEGVDGDAVGARVDLGREDVDAVGGQAARDEGEESLGTSCVTMTRSEEPRSGWWKRSVATGSSSRRSMSLMCAAILAGGVVDR